MKKIIVCMVMIAAAGMCFTQEDDRLDQVLGKLDQLDERFTTLENEVKELKSQQNTGAVSQQAFAVPEYIMGKGQMTAETMERFVLTKNRYADDAGKIAQFYVSEAALEGVNHDIAFAQMCIETNFLRFDNGVLYGYYNYGGFGAGPGSKLNQFPTMQAGIRAHIQHLKAYASKEKLKTGIVDPRYEILVQRKYIGTAPTVNALSGKWASDPRYGSKITAAITDMYHLSESNLTGE